VSRSRETTKQNNFTTKLLIRIKMKGRKQNKINRKRNGKKNRKNSLARNLKVVCVKDIPYCDYIFTATGISTTVFQISLLTPLMNNTGLLQQFPQHATPIYSNGVFSLRQKLRLSHLEIRMEMVGSQGSLLAAGDLYNSFRISIYRSGETYQSSVIRYLSSVMGATNLSDIEHVYYDNSVALPSQAWDSSSTTNVPCVKHISLNVPLNMDLFCFSTTPSGSGAAWESRDKDLLLEFVSDSTVTPNPTMTLYSRLFFRYK